MKAIVQIRGEVNRQEDVQDTLSMLNIHNVNHCALVPETDAYEGMIAKVNDYVAVGEPDADVLETLLAKRAEPSRETSPTLTRNGWPTTPSTMTSVSWPRHSSQRRRHFVTRDCHRRFDSTHRGGSRRYQKADRRGRPTRKTYNRGD